MFSPQIQGIINLSIPLIILYNARPGIFSRFYGKLACAIVVGFYIGFCHWQQGKNLAESLKYRTYATFMNKLTLSLI